jgi:vancomycin resistance protein YoaR
MPINDYYQEYGPMSRRRAGGGFQPPREIPPRRSRPAQRKGCLLPIALIILPLALLFLLPYVLTFRFRDQALPGISIQGQSVAGMSAAAIRADLELRHATFLRTPVTLVYAGQLWQPGLADLGARLELEELTQAAVTAGRRGSPITRLRELFTLYQDGLDLTPHLVVDQQTMQRYLLALAPSIEQPAQNARLSIAGGRTAASPSRPGTQLLIDTTSAEILLALRDLTPRELPLRTRALAPVIDDAAIATVQNQATVLLQAPIELRHTDRVWLWPPERIADLLELIQTEGGFALRPSTDRLTKVVATLAQEIDSEPAEPSLRFVNGQLEIALPGRPGWRLRQDEAVARLTTLLLSGAPAPLSLELPVDELTPRITAANLGELGIRELVAEGRSSFSGSASYRVTNIQAGARRMDGVLIAPDEEFSFNDQLGEINAAQGFVEGYAIIGNRTQLEWGGGVCQVSTTVFRTAFWAGLPITERHAHAFYISWYDRFGLGAYGDGQGMDAAIFTGVSDLRFVNDTGHWLLMQTVVDDAAQLLTVQLYGTRPDRQVLLEGPLISNEVRAPSEPVYIDDPQLPAGTLRQSDLARNGRDITIYRVIRQGDREVSRDTFFTRFRAWPNIFLRGTGT